MTRAVVYTDLDGSLLDHEDYSHAPADALLAELENEGVPVVPCTSKTRAELLPLREELGNGHPFIAENGAAVYIPAGYFPEPPEGGRELDGFWVKEFTRPRDHWLALLAGIAPEFQGRFTQFAHLDASQIAALTGLGEAGAGRAAQREYGEPVHWLGSDEARDRFVARVRGAGARVLRGGRFMHVSGHCDKGKALVWLNARYRAAAHGEAPVSIAVGDSGNDAAMLEAADYALIIRSPAHPPPALGRRHNLTISTGTGPAGWDQGVRSIFSQLRLPEG